MGLELWDMDIVDTCEIRRERCNEETQKLHRRDFHMLLNYVCSIIHTHSLSLLYLKATFQPFNHIHPGSLWPPSPCVSGQSPDGSTSQDWPSELFSFSTLVLFSSFFFNPCFVHQTDQLFSLFFFSPTFLIPGWLPWSFFYLCFDHWTDQLFVESTSSQLPSSANHKISCYQSPFLFGFLAHLHLWKTFQQINEACQVFFSLFYFSMYCTELLFLPPLSHDTDLPSYCLTLSLLCLTHRHSYHHFIPARCNSFIAPLLKHEIFKVQGAFKPTNITSLVTTQPSTNNPPFLCP